MDEDQPTAAGDRPVAIVAVMSDPQPWQMGLVYFDEKDWPVPGYRLIKRVTGTTAAELRRGE